jgi:hypothetical protein
MPAKIILAAPCAVTAAAVLFVAEADAGAVRRGNIREELCAAAATIAARKNGQPAPSGSVITLVNYPDDKLCRYVVMEKRTGWGSEYPPDQRTGEWESIPINHSKPMKPWGAAWFAINRRPTTTSCGPSVR